MDEASDDSTSTDSSTEENESTEEIDRDEIRKKVSEMSFEELMKMKEKMGSKLYNATVFGITEPKSMGAPKKTFKRLNKNRPREASSKRPVRTNNNLVVAAKKVHVRDPRFDPLCGLYDEKFFKNSYKFLTDVKRKECEELKKQLNDTEDPREKKKIKFVLQRLENQLREQRKQETKNQDADRERQEIKEKIKKGEKVHYKTKSERQIEGLVNKYEELKKTNKLKKYMEKKSKKNARKNRPTAVSAQ